MSSTIADRARRALSLVSLLILGSAASAVESSSAPASTERGFVLTAFAPAIHQSQEDCPEGLANTVSENYLQSLLPAERVRLQQPMHKEELAKDWKAHAVGPNHTNICENPESFDRPIQKTLRGSVALGLNLDGHADATTVVDGCAHQNFTSPGGESGIDNQAYRALGCTRQYRGVDGSSGDIVKGLNNFLATGEHSIVLLLRGVDSIANDAAVEVIIATTGDRPILDSRRNFITGASFTVSKNLQWHNILRGHISDGVLTTEPADIRLSRRLGYGGARGDRAEWDLRRARLRLGFQADGSLRGLLGAYQPIRNVIEPNLLGGVGAAVVAGVDCAADYATLKQLADGLRDAQTGQCTAVSVALDVAAVPAFVFDHPVAAR